MVLMSLIDTGADLEATDHRGLKLPNPSVPNLDETTSQYLVGRNYPLGLE